MMEAHRLDKFVETFERRAINIGFAFTAGPFLTATEQQSSSQSATVFHETFDAEAFDFAGDSQQTAFSQG